MSAAVVSDGWFDQVSAALAAGQGSDGVGAPDASAVVELVVSGGESGTVTTRWSVEGGRLVAVRPASAGDPPADVSAPVTAADLAAIVSGEGDAAIAFMRGDLKPDGSAAAWFAFVSAMNRPDTREALRT